MFVTSAGFFWSFVAWRFDWKVNAALAKGYSRKEAVQKEFFLFRMFMQVWLEPPAKA